jgi:hypothetical protein
MASFQEDRTSVMSEEDTQNEGQENTGNPGENGLKDGKDAEVRQATYDYQEAGRQGGGRSLKAPDGKYEGVTITYAPQSRGGPHQSRYGGRQYGHKRTSSHTAHPTHQTTPHASDVPYAKGEEAQGFFAWLRRKIGWQRVVVFVLRSGSLRLWVRLYKGCLLLIQPTL